MSGTDHDSFLAEDENDYPSMVTSRSTEAPQCNIDELLLPKHLRKDSLPVSQCNECGRKYWGPNSANTPCYMPQPSGPPCLGTLTPNARAE